MHRFAYAAFALIPALAVAAPAQAEVVARTDVGFASRNVVETTASPEETWRTLLEPALWWNSEHTWSGDAKNLKLDPRAGGCFCEVLPGEGGAPPRGGVEHMRVIFIDRDKALRLSGALGPLQSEGLVGTLTITLKPVEGGTRLTWEYTVAGFMRYKPEQIAPAVDKVLADQAQRLAEKLGAKAVTPEMGKLPEGPPDTQSGPPKAEPGMESGR